MRIDNGVKIISSCNHHSTLFPRHSILPSAPSLRPHPLIPSLPPRRALGLLFAVFTLSGFAGLVYESIWSHYLKLFLGHAAYSQVLVLVIFMGGMAIGSALAARFSTR